MKGCLFQRGDDREKILTFIKYFTRASLIIAYSSLLIDTNASLLPKQALCRVWLKLAQSK